MPEYHVYAVTWEIHAESFVKIFRSTAKRENIETYIEDWQAARGLLTSSTITYLGIEY